MWNSIFIFIMRWFRNFQLHSLLEELVGDDEYCLLLEKAYIIWNAFATKEKLTNRKAFMICFNIVDGAHNNYTLKS
jgi:hypothetical protein